MSTEKRTCLAIVLAAGEGTRMRSSLPKVLHAIAGRSMLEHVLDAVARAGADRVAVVIGPDHARIAQLVSERAPHARVFVQSERRGTAHAVLCARAAIEEGVDDVIVAYADTPLVEPETFVRLRRPLASGDAVSVLCFEASDPTGYGRLIGHNGSVVAIREEKDASDEERAITLCNAGIMALCGRRALSLLEAVDCRNAKGEFYLTDVVGIASARDLPVGVAAADEEEVRGANDRMQLAAAERVLQERLRRAAMAAGATLVDPDSVTLSFDTALGRDVLVEPHVVFRPGVTVEEGATIHAFSYLEGCRVGRDCSVGPFARLRPDTVLGAGARIGNFVEIKKAFVGEGAKIPHLSYVGDADIGARANLGAGTITCNYDGFDKHETVIGEGAFIGSNSALVAPLAIGSGAIVAAGSVVTSDVPADALAVARGSQVVKTGWAWRYRAGKSRQ